MGDTGGAGSGPGGDGGTGPGRNMRTILFGAAFGLGALVTGALSTLIAGWPS